MCRFRLHQAFNITGAVSVIAGAAIAFARLGDTLEAVGGNDHKIAGVIAFIGVLLLPIAGFIRPKKAGPGAKRSKLRRKRTKGPRATRRKKGVSHSSL